MDDRIDLYRVHVQNVRALNRARKQMTLLVNDAIRRNNSALIVTLTKSLVLLFSAWEEANFAKLIYTPRGFSENELTQIKQAYSQSLEQAWDKCIDLGLRKVRSNPKRSSYIPNVQKRLSQIVQEYVIDPRIIRNKIAHGQWEIALNRTNTAVNREITLSIQSLDVVIVLKWFRIFQYLSDIVEILIESPGRAFHRDYWVILGELEEYLEKTKSWSIVTKRKQLLRKSHRGSKYQ